MDKEKELEALGEKKLSSEKIFEGKILRVMVDGVLLPNGKEAKRECVRHNGAVAIIPVTAEGKIVVERQYRYPVNEVLTEIPAGKLDYPGEDMLSAAKRELREETGFTADEWTDLGFIYPAVGYSDEKIRLYMAKGLHKGERELDEDEFLNYDEAELDTLVGEVMNGKIPDSKTQAGILRAAVILKGLK